MGKSQKPSDSKLVQLSARSIVFDPILDNNGKIKDFQLRIAPMFRGGSEVGKFLINNPTNPNVNPAQYLQHYIPLKWSKFQEICSYNPKLQDKAKFKKSDILKQLQKFQSSGRYPSKLKYTPNGALHPDSKLLEFIHDTDGFNFDAQVDKYTDLTKADDNKYDAINWSNISAPVSTQFPDWEQMQHQNLRQLLLSDVKVVPINIDDNGHPQDYKFRIRPLYRDNDVDHQAHSNLVDDGLKKETLNFFNFDGSIMSKHGYYQDISRQDFNKILKMSNQSELSLDALSKLPFQKVNSDNRFDTKIKYQPYQLPLEQSLMFDAWAPLFSFKDKNQQTHAFRYIEPSVIMKAGQAKFLKTQADKKAETAILKKPFFNPKLKIKSVETLIETMNTLADKGTAPDDHPKIDDQGNPLSKHQTFTTALSDLLSATQMQLEFKNNQAKAVAKSNNHAKVKDVSKDSQLDR